MDQSVLITGLIVCFARILDVSLGTFRTIVTVQGRMVLAFVLGVLEISIWVSVVSTVIIQINDSPILVVFYALGYASGNVVGILAEQKIALGPIVLRLITTEELAMKMIDVMKELNLEATTFSGMGTRGPVVEIYTVCRRKDLKQILPMLRSIDPDAFYVTEQVKDVSKILRPIPTPPTGWRAVLKKK